MDKLKPCPFCGSAAKVSHWMLLPEPPKEAPHEL